ncbi:uncharacterized protein LOC127875328 [Dreissena polymorpha]|uniref:EF-hand domain-containing protein n=1 Tax=Dreissena polymorpha TaxID=45954 RepID=A0A9D4R3C6_DREPO|nr:uncharacterized protein LOC127875328 [Dreissena polymorpha]XP_052276281.1 uncharacterized protein LOC127875328 [Dreissena polymorpha]KAH3853561.1 hypothetical protein DPMN_096089 [Dreissena polymorpha]
MASKLSEDQIKAIKDAFFMFDVQDKGTIPTNDLGNAIRALGRNPSEAEVKMMSKEADAKGTGFITEKDFEDTVSKHWNSVSNEDEIIEAFQQFDREGTGYIDAKQLRHVLQNMGERLQEAEVDALMEVADLDSDGQLNYRSLTQMLLAK